VGLLVWASKPGGDGSVTRGTIAKLSSRQSEVKAPGPSDALRNSTSCKDILVF